MTSEIQTRVLRKITWRIVPFIMLLYFVAFIDRVNIGFASLTMNKDIGLSPVVYGFGAGIFFWGYFLFEVPSNIILHKIGARIWIARVMITWGIVSAAMAFVQGATSFYILRFLLGVAQTWSNSRTGNSGRISVLSSSYGPPIDGRNIRYGAGVQSLPSYEAAGGAYVASSNANLRAGPSTSAKVVGKVAAGESFDALGVAPNGGWVLVGRNGYATGYAAASLVRPYGQQVASCRVIDASVAGGGQRASSQRYSACKDNRGEWQVTQA